MNLTNTTNFIGDGALLGPTSILLSCLRPGTTKLRQVKKNVYAIVIVHLKDVGRLYRFLLSFIPYVYTKSICYCLRTGLLLLLLVEGKEGDTGNLADLESDTGNITDGVARSAETGDEDLVVLVDVVEATIAGDEGSDLLAVLDELNTDALTDGGVGLLGLDADLLEHNALGHGGATHGVGLHGGDGVGLAVLLISPSLGAPVSSELTTGVDSLRLAHLVLSPFGVLLESRNVQRLVAAAVLLCEWRGVEKRTRLEIESKASAKRSVRPHFATPVALQRFALLIWPAQAESPCNTELSVGW